MDRREFISASAGLAGLAASAQLARGSEGTAERMLKILFLGGTGFLGPHTVQYAIDRGHEVTLFNRGRTNADLFPELEKIVGNRDPEVDQGLTGLRGREWDAVIDTSGYVPRITGASAGLLADSVEQYLFVSTICTYEGWETGEMYRTEETPRGVLEDPTTEDVQTHYCYLKGYCERAIEDIMPGRTTHVRPGLIVGPGDRTDRFTYWPVRAARGGEMLAPGKPSDLTQYIDVRDLGRFIVHCLEQRATEDYNVACYPRPIGGILESCVRVADNGTRLTWVPADVLAEHGLRSWYELQLWADSASAGAGSLTWSTAKALDAGLTVRPIDDTVRDTLDWFRTRPAERQSALRSGIPADKEADVLAAWRAADA